MSEKLQGGLLAGSVDLSIPVILRSTTDNTEVTGKAYGDVTASYLRQGGIRVDIPAITLAAVNSAHADGGFKEIDATNMPGLYRFDLPDAAQATGADWVVITIKVAGAYVFFQMFNLTANIIDLGAGAISWTYTLPDSATGGPIDGAEIWVTSDSAGLYVLASGITDSAGLVTFMLDAGTVFVWAKKAGYNMDDLPDEEVVA